MPLAINKFVVGLTGGIGSGKSEVSRRFEQYGINVIDADIVSRQVVEPNTPALSAIEAHFGGAIILPNGSLDRATLRNIIFADHNQKAWLENLLHPLIRSHIIEQLQHSQSPYVILSSPLLLETTQHELVDRVLVVDAPEELQLARACARDSNNQAQIKSIMAAQLSRNERTARAHDIIYNHSNLISLDQDVADLHSRYLTLAQHHD